MIQLLKSEMIKFKGSYQLYIILILSEKYFSKFHSLLISQSNFHLPNQSGN